MATHSCQKSNLEPCSAYFTCEPSNTAPSLELVIHTNMAKCQHCSRVGRGNQNSLIPTVYKGPKHQFLTWKIKVSNIYPAFLQGYCKDNIYTSQPGITYPSSHSPHAACPLTIPSITWLFNAAKILHHLFLLSGIPSPIPLLPSDFCSHHCLWEVSSFWLPVADLGVSIVSHVSFMTSGSTSVSFVGCEHFKERDSFPLCTSVPSSFLA